MHTFIYQNTVNHDTYVADATTSGNSDTYIHIGFTIDANAQAGEYRYYLIPYTEGEVKLDVNKVMVDGVEVKPLCSGLMVYGAVEHTQNQYNKETEYIQYGG